MAACKQRVDQIVNGSRALLLLLPVPVHLADRDRLVCEADLPAARIHLYQRQGGALAEPVLVDDLGPSSRKDFRGDDPATTGTVPDKSVDVGSGPGLRQSLDVVSARVNASG